MHIIDLLATYLIPAAAAAAAADAAAVQTTLLSCHAAGLD